MGIDNWKKWEKRDNHLTVIDKNDVKAVYMELERLNGFDIGDGFIPDDAWH